MRARLVGPSRVLPLPSPTQGFLLAALAASCHEGAGGSKANRVAMIVCACVWEAARRAT